MIHPALSALRRSLALATRRERAAPWTLLALSCTLFIVAIAVIAAASIDRFAAAHPGRGSNMVVYLGDGVDEARAQALVGELRGLRGVEGAELVSPAESGRRLVRALGPDPALLDGVDPAGLPASVEVKLSPGVRDVVAMSPTVRALRGVDRAELVSAEESARRLARALGSDPALLDGVDVASLPASVEVTLAPGVRDVVAMSPTVRALRGAPGIARVVVDPAEESTSLTADSGGVEDRLAQDLHAAPAVAWTGAALLAALALIIMLATVRLGFARSPKEAAVLRLLGAAPGFIAIPSAIAGALQGAIAAVIAAGALVIVLHVVLAGPGAQLGAIAVVSPPAAALAGLVALGALVGFVGGGLAGVARAP